MSPLLLRPCEPSRAPALPTHSGDRDVSPSLSAGAHTLPSVRADTMLSAAPEAGSLPNVYLQTQLRTRIFVQGPHRQPISPQQNMPCSLIPSVTLSHHWNHTHRLFVTRPEPPSSVLSPAIPLPISSRTCPAAHALPSGQTPSPP